MRLCATLLRLEPEIDNEEEKRGRIMRGGDEESETRGGQTKFN